MDEQEKVICEAQILYEPRKPFLLIGIIFFAIYALMFLFSPLPTTMFLGLLVPIITVVLICLIVYLYEIRQSDYAKNTNVKLTNKRLQGQRKYKSGVVSIDIPLNKLDNLAVVENAYTKNQGKTMLIYSGSGKIDIRYVRNAEEFKNATIQAVEQFQKQSTAAPTSASTSESSSIDAIAKLNALREQGILTQEEFDQKKAELLSKI